MTIKNISKKTLLAEDAVYADSLKKQAFGLLLYKTPRVMIFHTRFGIHTFGMQYPIDVCILDDEKKVVKIKRKLQPNRILLWNPKYKIIIELPVDSVKKTKTELGDTFTIS